MVTVRRSKEDETTVSATEAKNKFGTVLAQAREKPIIIESHGHATAVVISIDEYEKYKAVREKQERDEAIERLRVLRAEAERRNSDLTPEQAEALINEIVDDTFARMITEGKLRYDE